MLLRAINRSIFRRLLFGYLLTVLLGLGVVGIVISFLAKGYIYDSTQNELLRKAKKVNLAIQDGNAADASMESLLLFFDQTFDARIWIFDRNGSIIATSTKDEVFIGKSVAVSIARKVAAGESAVSELAVEGLSQPMLSVAVPWGKDDRIYGGIVLHSPVNGIQETVSQIRETILWGTLIGVLLTTAMVSYLSWSISRPLQAIDRAASEIGMGNYAKRIEIDSTDEIGDLAQTINSMAGKLEQTERERSKAEQIRTDFLANVSHELRTPLTAMQGFLEALQDGLIDEERRQPYYDIMMQETLHMNRLLDDITMLDKLKNGEIRLAPHPVDVRSFLQSVELKFGTIASSKRLELHVDCPDGLPPIHADYDRLEQIISNVVGNAIKFTERGSVRIGARREGAFVVFVVADTGIGIAPADREFIWDRFFKADRGRAKNQKGTGLGLAIVKELVELHGGTIGVESEPDRGATFTIRFPAVRSEGVSA
ncbi:sensor histidine kinase [Paenibacillus flagellatus]|uniref:histidine kinase n=1 Tax=Paenibacillus flagellatus TaxID=2211139 RepID=A0A2V5KC99_9BACL|nr:HAMP domain-containing sensor histidine kinase [Paenibacillus flagellatus]PYI57225.1 two-component sensor histidine kinase [Paenibacillus flagellatus]